MFSGALLLIQYNKLVVPYWGEQPFLHHHWSQVKCCLFVGKEYLIGSLSGQLGLTQLQPSTQNKPLINRFLEYTYFFYCYLSHSLCLSNWPLKSSCNFVLADITSSNQNPHTVINWHNYLNWTRIFFVAKWQADSEAKDIKYSLLFTLPSIKIRTTNKIDQ